MGHTLPQQWLRYPSLMEISQKHFSYLHPEDSAKEKLLLFSVFTDSALLVFHVNLSETNSLNRILFYHVVKVDITLGGLVVNSFNPDFTTSRDMTARPDDSF